MKRSIYLLGFLLFLSSNLYSKDFRIFFVKKEFDLGIKGKELTKDYYTNIGVLQGVLEGTYLDVYRKIQVIDSKNSSMPIETKIFVGQLKVIFVNQNIAIARTAGFSDLSKNPILEYSSFMIGDIVEIGKPKNRQTAIIDNISKKSPKTFLSNLINTFVHQYKEGLILKIYKL